MHFCGHDVGTGYWQLTTEIRKQALKPSRHLACSIRHQIS